MSNVRPQGVASFPFTDLHSYKDFVVFVAMCAPERFPRREGVNEDEQWSLGLAFAGLRSGLSAAVKEKGPQASFSACAKLIEEAFAAYQEGRSIEGASQLREMAKLLRRVPSR